MAAYQATVDWQRQQAVFVDQNYSRAHTWAFDGGVVVPASSSPHVVPVPFSNPAHVDPEEAFVAALASCHMLWFLSFAAREGFVVERYTDDALGVMEPDAAGRLAMTRVTLRPQIVFGGSPTPTDAQIADLHHRAHTHCYLANSVKTAVVVAPVAPIRAGEGA